MKLRNCEEMVSSGKETVENIMKAANVEFTGCPIRAVMLYLDLHLSYIIKVISIQYINIAYFGLEVRSAYRQTPTLFTYCSRPYKVDGKSLPTARINK